MRHGNLLRALVLATLGFGVGAANAQTPAPTTVPEKIAPGAKPTAPAETLSKKLDQSGGVIAPKDPDPGMSKGAPTTGDPSIIKPPATGGSAGAPVAK